MTTQKEICDCCGGKGLVTTEFADDFSSCLNCNGRGSLVWEEPQTDYAKYRGKCKEFCGKCKEFCGKCKEFCGKCKEFCGKCKEFCEKAVAKDPTLVMVRGHYFCPIWNTDKQHWWCKRQDGTIFDPTKDQFPSKGHGIYEEFDGWCVCEYCGNTVHEDNAYFVEHHVYCSGTCYGHDVGF